MRFMCSSFSARLLRVERKRTHIASGATRCVHPCSPLERSSFFVWRLRGLGGGLRRIPRGAAFLRPFPRGLLFIKFRVHRKIKLFFLLALLFIT